jgi:hypothetical protein
LEARRKPLAFAADALSLWIFNRSLLTINELFHYPAKQMKRSNPAHGPVYCTIERPRRLRLRSCRPHRPKQRFRRRGAILFRRKEPNADQPVSKDIPLVLGNWCGDSTTFSLVASWRSQFGCGTPRLDPDLPISHCGRQGDDRGFLHSRSHCAEFG